MGQKRLLRNYGKAERVLTWGSGRLASTFHVAFPWQDDLGQVTCPSGILNVFIMWDASHDSTSMSHKDFVSKLCSSSSTSFPFMIN